jgi:hypothetical protein
MRLAPGEILPEILFGEIQAFNEIVIEVKPGGELDVLNRVGELIGHLPVSLRKQDHGSSRAGSITERLNDARPYLRN